MVETAYRWREGLAHSSRAAFGRLVGLLGASEITSDTREELEALLIRADVGIGTTADVIAALQRISRSRGLRRASDLWQSLRAELRARLDEPPPIVWTLRPSVLLIVGVNGSGKTTTITKLSRRFRAECPAASARFRGSAWRERHCPG